MDIRMVDSHAIRYIYVRNELGALPVQTPLIQEASLFSSWLERWLHKTRSHLNTHNAVVSIQTNTRATHTTQAPIVKMKCEQKRWILKSQDALIQTSMHTPQHIRVHLHTIAPHHTSTHTPPHVHLHTTPDTYSTPLHIHLHTTPVHIQYTSTHPSPHYIHLHV